jgi:hypothetical protein
MDQLDNNLPLIRQIQRILRLSAQPGSRHRSDKSWPTPSQYARYCRCSPQQLSKFANGHTTSLRHDVIDDLAILMGLFPSGTEEERKWRLQHADKWLKVFQLQVKHATVSDYLLHRHRIRKALEFARSHSSLTR